MEILIALLIMLVMILLGVPICFSLGLAAVYALFTRDISFQLIPQRMYTSIDQFALLAIPLYIFVGEAMNTGGVTDRLFGFCRKMLGHVRGSLGHVNVMASVIFAGMSGAAVADAAGLGKVELNAMEDAGFDMDFSAAITAASSTIGPIIPPSIPLVLYAVIAEQSVGRLFIGGTVPGLLMAGALCVMVYVISVKRNYPVDPKCSGKEKLVSFFRAFPSLMTPAIILFGIFSGAISPTESAAIAAVWSLFLGFVVHKEMTLKDLYQIAKRTVVASATVLMMISASSIMTWLVISSGAPKQFAAALTAISSNRYVLLLLINILLLIMGCFLDATAIITIMVPMLLPIAEMIGVDLVAFGVIVVLNAMIGLITPPVGMCLSVTADIAGLPMSKVVKPMLVFAIPLVVVLALITIFPQIITFLPDLLMGK
ncbi:MAG: TRAP transporter large permease [Oscillospiraceae bacterium]|nr:TRAP transporter large permease [Oscillospiraceae bacterium]